MALTTVQGQMLTAPLTLTGNLTFSDGSVQTAAASPYVLKNRIINGAMQIWQRGTSFSGNGYTADRWYAGNSPTAVTQSTDVPTGFQYSLDITGANHLINQRIESYNILDTYGQSLTLSFWAKSISGTNTLTVQIGTPSALNNFAIQNVEQTSSAITLTSSWARYTVTFSSLSSSVSNGAFIYIYRNGSTSTDETRFTGVQLEIGTSATPFERRLYNQELANCQRYLPSSGITSNYYAGVSTSTTNAYAPIPLPVPARVAPTGITIASGTYYWLNGSGTQNTATVVFNSAGYQGAMVQITTTGATLGQAGLFNPNGATILFTGCEL